MRLRLISALVGLSFAAVAVNCSLSANEDAAPGGLGGSGASPTGAGGTGDAGIDANVGDADPEAGPPDFGELCGGGCVPGVVPDECASDAGSGGAGGGIVSAEMACQLQYDEPSSSFVGECGPVGEIASGYSCLESDDCAAGLACVGEPGALACRPYCCGPVEECPADTFCRPVPWAESPGTGDDAILIPVCWPATPCLLFDQTACPIGEVCAIVRVDGTTSCVEPGPGQLGDPCAKIGDCAEGFVCSIPKGECMQLCRIGRSEDCDEGQECHAGSTIYPTGFGVCVGTG